MAQLSTPQPLHELPALTHLPGLGGGGCPRSLGYTPAPRGKAVSFNDTGLSPCSTTYELRGLWKLDLTSLGPVSHISKWGAHTIFGLIGILEGFKEMMP